MINLPQLQAVMAAATKFIGETAPEKLAALHNLANASKRETFRICITGGFSRGKSHLLNELLGADLLPEAAVPTTGCVTEICYGERPELEIIQDGKVKRQTLDKEALRAWTIGECQPGAVTLRIFCPDPLLERGLVLIDTPGVEDTIAESADQAYKALENADAAIVLISAVAPFSLTEQQFVHAYMQDRSIPLLAFCVSFLDQVAPGSEGQQLNYIRKKCAELYPGCPLLTAATPTPDPAGYICGTANIRKQLKEWEDLPELPRLRAKMILDRLSALLTAQNQKLEATLKLLNSDYQTKQREIREAIAKIDGHSDVCDKLRTEFGEKAEDIASIARRRIRSFGENCAADLEEKNFSEDELVESFQHLYEELAAYVKNGLQADIERLSRKMRELYSLPLNLDAGQYIPPSIGIPLTRNTEPAQSSAWMVEEILRRGQIFMDTYGNKLPYITDSRFYT